MRDSYEPRINQVVVDRDGYTWFSCIQNDGKQYWYCPRTSAKEMDWDILVHTRGPLEAYPYERTVRVSNLYDD